jgi:hypothetical protein
MGGFHTEHLNSINSNTTVLYEKGDHISAMNLRSMWGNQKSALKLKMFEFTEKGIGG